MLVFKVPLPEKFKDLEYWHVTCNFVVLALNNIHGTVKALELMQQYFPAYYADVIAADMKSNYSYPKHVLEYRAREKKDFLNFMCDNTDTSSLVLNVGRDWMSHDPYKAREFEWDDERTSKLYKYMEGFSYSEHDIKYGSYGIYSAYMVIRSYLKCNCHNQILDFI